MREPVVKGDVERQVLSICAHDDAAVIEINAGMVPRLVSELMLAAVALGLNLDYPLPPAPKGN